jgi:hypothetical protein
MGADLVMQQGLPAVRPEGGGFGMNSRPNDTISS